MIKTWLEFLFNVFIGQRQGERPFGWREALGGELSSTVHSERAPCCSCGSAEKLKSEQFAAQPACVEGCGHPECDLQNPTFPNDLSHLSFFS